MTTAVLSNADHPEFGVVTIPLPIPREQYDHCVSMLEALEIGDASAADCRLDDLWEAWPVLNCLQGTKVNLDELDYDGRFSPQNKTWAASTFIPPSDRNYEFVVESHPAVLDGFVKAFREAQAELKLFDRSQCDDMTTQDLEGKVLVMSPFTLKESYWAPENQLWLATGGFGCVPTAAGRAVYATCLGDGEQVRWNRSDFIGILREEHLPDWARERLEQLQQESPSTPEMNQPSM